VTIYTIVPEEQIFAEAAPSLSQVFEVQYQGVPLQVHYQGGRSFRVDRVLSTDPADYLNQSVQPGVFLPVIQSEN
jgi:hypothetical protein